MNETAGRELQVPKQLDELQIALEALEKQISSLFARLQKVTLQAGPQVENANAKNPTQLCEYAENLAEKSRMVRRLRDDIASLESRLEL